MQLTSKKKLQIQEEQQDQKNNYLTENQPLKKVIEIIQKDKSFTCLF